MNSCSDSEAAPGEAPRTPPPSAEAPRCCASWNAARKASPAPAANDEDWRGSAASAAFLEFTVIMVSLV